MKSVCQEEFASKGFFRLVAETLKEHKDSTFATWYDSKGKPSDEWTFGEIWEQAGIIAYYLRNVWKVEKKERVVLCYDFGLNYFASFIGCLRAGVTAVLVYPPGPPLSRSLPMLSKVIVDCSPRYILTDSLIDKIHLLDTKVNFTSRTRKLWPSVEFKVTDKLANGKHSIEAIDSPNIEPEHIAFLQYTSGSTAEPKGVMVSLAALEANLRVLHSGMFERADEFPSNAAGFSWLPQYHDLGLLLTILPFVCGKRMHFMSPVAFMHNPLLWIKLLSSHQVHWSLAPNFAIRLVVRKFLEEKENLQQEPIKGLDLRSLRKIQVCAEPVQVDTEQIFYDAFSNYGLRRKWLQVGYGLAEHVVGVGWIDGLHQPFFNDTKTSEKVVAVASRETLHPTITAKIVDPDDMKELPDGETGELWVSGPSVASGYWKQAELSKEIFEATICCDTTNEAKAYLRTGDLAFFDDSGKLFIRGRLKDLIIVNGKNFYPQDIEVVVQEASKAVRPGCIAAFSSEESSDDLIVVFEMRQSMIREGPQVCESVNAAVIASAGLALSRLVAIRERTIPKTTSGKIRRRQTRKMLSEGLLDVVYEDIARSLRSYPPPCIAEDLPTDSLPESVMREAQSLRLDKGLLDYYFRKLSLDTVPGMAEAWHETEKSNFALQIMVQSVLKAAVTKYPTLVQFIHLLVQRPEWVLPDDGRQKMLRLAHSCFVLDWATRKLCPSTSEGEALLAKTIAIRDETERSLVQKLGFLPADVPSDARFLSDDIVESTFGMVGLFQWMKVRSARLHAKSYLKDKPDEQCTAKRATGLTDLELNVIEAIWLDHTGGFYSNASVGQWLVNRLALNPREVSYEWTCMYAMWNMAVCTTFIQVPRFQELLLTMLFIPCLVYAPSEEYVMYRAISLYLVAQISLENELKGLRTTKRWLPLEAATALGELNRRYAFKKEFDPAVDWKDPVGEANPVPAVREWLKKFDLWSGREIINPSPQSSGDQNMFEIALAQVLGPNVSLEKDWDEIGLSSILSVQLRDSLRKSFMVELPPGCFEQYRTPSELKAFILESQGRALQVRLGELPLLDKGRLSWATSGIVQVIGALFILLVFAGTFLSAFYAGKFLEGFACLTSDDEVNSRYARWRWIPIIFPVWAMTLSLAVLLVKWSVVGKYREGIIRAPSMMYLRWWLVDRFIHLWEFWVGRFFLDTPLIWIFYRLLGAKVHPSVQIKAFVREFDLLEIKQGSKLEEQIRCRVFAPWEIKDAGPEMRFRTISIGEDCTIGGLLQPGCVAGDFSKVENLSAVSEGSVIPPRVSVSGNPAVETGHVSDSVPREGWVELGGLKLVWLLAELWLFFAILLLSHIVLNDRTFTKDRYGVLLYWFLMVFLSQIFAVVVSVILKWALIGRRQPGPYVDNLWQRIADWAADYHFTISMAFLLFVSSNSKIWNLVLKSHGMDIDWISTVNPSCFKPSNLDLITVNESFLSRCSFETRQRGVYHCTKVTNGSTLSYGVHVGPGVSISNCTIPAFTFVRSNVCGPEEYNYNIGSKKPSLELSEACTSIL